jgi:ankyrin repeat protein
MLKELAETLDETYERILRDINKANRDHAHRLLQCLTVAVRPLRVAELAEVLAVDFGTASRGGTSKLNTDWRWEDQQEAVLSTCSSLISVVDEEGSQIVQFSHFSVKEFLTSSRIADSSVDVSAFHILFEPAHTILAKACLVVLLRLDEIVGKYNVKNKFPLARYAGEHWVDHARFENVSSHIREGMEDLFDPDKPYFAAWLQIHDIDTEPFDGSLLSEFAPSYRMGSNSAIPLYYAALCGFHDVAEQLIIKHPQQVYTTGGYFVSPLGAALRGEHLKIAEVLHERGADVDVQGHYKCTPLDGASSSGHLKLVHWLLSRSANPNARDGDGWTPLHSAAYFGHVEVSRLLLQYKAVIYAHDNQGRAPLHLAVQYGRVNVARLLLEYGADIDAHDNEGRTPLHVAAQYACVDLARLLLEHGAYVNARDKSRVTPLLDAVKHKLLEHRITRRRPLEVARLLVEHGANTGAEDDVGRTAFQLASGYGYHDFAKFLSDHGSK